ncbi:hypothetical protein [Nonomuraea candida]|uniref:hypothetical protein n=1 Tax=Nonomuraea candida TaxID=359159 RepID=UPI000ADAA2E6|nr:hypothetical protein [Nonomuraea candida]
MGAMIRALAGLGTAAALTLTTFAVATPAGASATSMRPDPTCHYVNQSDDPAPIREGPGKKHRKRAELAPTADPVRATCAARGRGPEHWVRLKGGDHKGLWIWRDRLQPWSG